MGDRPVLYHVYHVVISVHWPFINVLQLYWPGYRLLSKSLNSRSFNPGSFIHSFVDSLYLTMNTRVLAYLTFLVKDEAIHVHIPWRTWLSGASPCCLGHFMNSCHVMDGSSAIYPPDHIYWSGNFMNYMNGWELRHINTLSHVLFWLLYDIYVWMGLAPDVTWSHLLMCSRQVSVSNHGHQGASSVLLRRWNQQH